MQPPTLARPAPPRQAPEGSKQHLSQQVQEALSCLGRGSRYNLDPSLSSGLYSSSPVNKIKRSEAKLVWGVDPRALVLSYINGSFFFFRQGFTR